MSKEHVKGDITGQRTRSLAPYAVVSEVEQKQLAVLLDTLGDQLRAAVPHPVAREAKARQRPVVLHRPPDEFDLHTDIH